MMNFRKLMGYTACGLIMGAFALSADAMEPKPMTKYDEIAVQKKEAGDASKEQNEALEKLDKFMEFLQSDQELAKYIGVSIGLRDKNSNIIENNADKEKEIRQTVYEIFISNKAILPIAKTRQDARMIVDFYRKMQLKMSKEEADQQKERAEKKKARIKIFEQDAELLVEIETDIKGSIEQLQEDFKKVDFNDFGSNKQFEASKKAIDTFIKKLTTIKNGSEAYISGLKTNSESQKNLIKEVHSSINSTIVTTQIFMDETFRTALGQLYTEMSGLNKEKTRLTGEVTSLTQEIERAEKNTEDLQAKIQELEHTNKDLDNKLIEALKNIDQKDTQIGILESIKAMNKILIANLQKTIDNLKDESDKKDEQIEQLNQSINETQELAELRKEVVKKKNSNIKSLKDQLTSMQQIISQKDTDLSNVLNNMSQLKQVSKAVVDELTNINTTQKARLISYEKYIHQANNKLRELNTQLKNTDDLLIKRLLELMDYDYFDVSSDARNKPAIVSIIRENYEFLNRVWDKVIAQNNDKNATRDESLPLPENLEEATLKKFL